MQKKIINVLDLSIQRRQLILLKIIFRLRNVISIESKKFLTHRLNLNEKKKSWVISEDRFKYFKPLETLIMNDFCS